MRILLDESVPRKLGFELSGHTVQTTQKRGWAGLKNGILLQAASREFDIFITRTVSAGHTPEVYKLTLSVRVPPRVERELAEYCARNKLSKSEAVKRALQEFLVVSKDAASPYELGRDLFGDHTDEAPSDNVARNSKKLLRQRLCARAK